MSRSESMSIWGNVGTVSGGQVAVRRHVEQTSPSSATEPPSETAEPGRRLGQP